MNFLLYQTKIQNYKPAYKLATSYFYSFFIHAETLSRRDGENTKLEARIYKQIRILNFLISKIFFHLKVLSERCRSSSAGLASELKIKSYSTLKIPRNLVLYRSIEGSTAGNFN